MWDETSGHVETSWSRDRSKVVRVCSSTYGVRIDVSRTRVLTDTETKTFRPLGWRWWCDGRSPCQTVMMDLSCTRTRSVRWRTIEGSSSPGTRRLVDYTGCRSSNQYRGTSPKRFVEVSRCDVVCSAPDGLPGQGGHSWTFCRGTEWGPPVRRPTGSSGRGRMTRTLSRDTDSNRTL